MYRISTLKTVRYCYGKLKGIQAEADICQVHGFGRLNILKKFNLSESVYGINTAPIKIPALI